MIAPTVFLLGFLRHNGNRNHPQHDYQRERRIFECLLCAWMLYITIIVYEEEEERGGDDDHWWEDDDLDHYNDDAYNDDDPLQQLLEYVYTDYLDDA